MQILILSSSQDETQVLSELISPYYSTDTFSCVDLLKKKINSSPKTSDFVLVTGFSLEIQTLNYLLLDFLNSNPPIKFLLIASDPKEDESSLEIIREKYSVQKILFLSYQNPIEDNAILEKLQFGISLISNSSPLSQLIPSHNHYQYLHARNPGRILSAARENLGLTLQDIAQSGCTTRAAIQIDRLREIENDTSGDLINPSEWHMLCQLFEIDCNSITFGFEANLHLARCASAIEQNGFKLPVTEHFRKKLFELAQKKSHEAQLEIAPPDARKK